MFWNLVVNMLILQTQDEGDSDMDRIQNGRLSLINSFSL